MLTAGTHVKPPEGLRLQKTSPEFGNRTGGFRRHHGFPGTELLVLQPLPPQLNYLLETELLVWCVTTHFFYFSIFNFDQPTMTPWRTLPLEGTNEEEQEEMSPVKKGLTCFAWRPLLAKNGKKFSLFCQIKIYSQYTTINNLNTFK